MVDNVKWQQPALDSTNPNLNPLTSRAFFRSVQKKAHSEVLSDRSSARGTCMGDHTILMSVTSAFQKGGTLYASEQV